MPKVCNVGNLENCCEKVCRDKIDHISPIEKVQFLMLNLSLK